jgi:putative endonuclease
VAQNTRQILGRLGERLALEHYERLGFQLLDRNHRTPAGEIDLVVCDGATTVFAEVKTRTAGGLDPLLAITALKRRRMRMLAAAWMASRAARPRTPALRIDAVAVVVDARGMLVSLEQIENVA